MKLLFKLESTQHITIDAIFKTNKFLSLSFCLPLPPAVNCYQSSTKKNEFYFSRNKHQSFCCQIKFTRNELPLFFFLLLVKWQIKKSAQRNYALKLDLF